ncbi:MAG: acetyl-CoA carboxylase, carboxyltransferase subunit beta [Oscillospiraceae bacterium]|jgi:acetyl-CoA carboxylase carboxyl transferase subunit beta|nr:acetyl-CoA carboxylase, carboxyltransferase subunit beta [Oscillospiraceae bacterium]
MQNPFSERKVKLDLLKSLRSIGRKSAPSPTPYVSCPRCKADHERAALASVMNVCPRCGRHMHIAARERLLHLFDEGSITECFAEVKPRDALGFPGYAKKLAETASKTGLPGACVCVTGTVEGNGAVAAALDTDFMMGSMGAAVGEKITLATEYAQSSQLPLIVFCAGGGARMQEGIFALMQMAKTAAAIKRFSDSGGLFIAYITHPTTGGITASFASLGDITLAEPGALFGFAGPRVIEQTIGEKLPDGFQSAEFQLEHGFVDAIVARADMRATIAQLLRLHRREAR